MVHRPMLLKMQLLILNSNQLYIHIHTPNLKLFGLHTQIVTQLTLLSQKISIIPIVKVLPILS